MNVTPLRPDFAPKPQHDRELCAAGQCSHAVSERVLCLCPDCDATTAAMVAGYQTQAMHTNADEQSETTPRFALRTFDRFIIDEGNGAAYEAARGVVTRPNTGLGIHGAPGVGKSHLGAAIVNACKAAGIAARFVSIDDLLSRIRATFDSKTAGNEHGIIRAFASVPVLVIDDLGKESLSDWTVRTMFSLINRRYEQALPLVVTSNFSPAHLASRSVDKSAEPMTYASTFDRIGEMTGAWVSIAGASRR